MIYSNVSRNKVLYSEKRTENKLIYQVYSCKEISDGIACYSRNGRFKLRVAKQPPAPAAKRACQPKPQKVKQVVVPKPKPKTQESTSGGETKKEKLNTSKQS